MEKLKEYLNPGSKEEEEAKLYVEQLRELLTHDCNRDKKEGRPVLVFKAAYLPGWKICLFLPSRTCDQQQFFRCDVRAKPISRRHATNSRSC